MLSIDTFLSDQKAIHKFKQILSSGDPGPSKEDPFYREVFESLLRTLLDLPHLEVQKQQKLLPLISELIQFEWGLEATLQMMHEQADRGIATKILALPTIAACRRANDYPRAVTALNRLAKLLPEDGYTNLVYGQALAANAQYDELSKLARRQRENLELTEWLISQWAMLLSNNLELEEAESWVKLLPSDGPQQQLLNVKIDSFLQSEESLNIPTHVISLFRDDRKWNIADQHLRKGGYKPQRFKATDGREMSIYALERLGSNPSTFATHGAGAIATALSHISVAEQFLQSGAPQCMILEDDASPYFHSSYYQEIIERTVDFDFVWINERMSRQFGTHRLSPQSFSSPMQILGSRDPRLNGVGADGYLLTRTGAEKLLKLVDQDKIHAHIDAQFAAYCSYNGRTPLELSRGQEVILRLRESLPSFKNQIQGLNSVCLDVPMVWANNHGSSDTFAVSAERRKHF